MMYGIVHTTAHIYIEREYGNDTVCSTPALRVWLRKAEEIGYLGKNDEKHTHMAATNLPVPQKYTHISSRSSTIQFHVNPFRTIFHLYRELSIEK